MDAKERAELIAELLASGDPKRQAAIKAKLTADIKSERDPKRQAERGKEFVALVKAMVAMDATRAAPAAAAPAAAATAAAAPDATHEALNEELYADIRAYIDAPNVLDSEGHKTYPISDKLAASAARWPKVTEEIVVYRGQSKKHLKIPTTETRKHSFFSATDDLDIARYFSQDGGNIFKITLKPGVRFLRVLPRPKEGEILVAADGVPEYGDKKVRVNDKWAGIWNMAIPVTIYPKPEGGRRTRRRLTRRRLTRRRRIV